MINYDTAPIKIKHPFSENKSLILQTRYDIKRLTKYLNTNNETRVLKLSKYKMIHAIK